MAWKTVEFWISPPFVPLLEDFSTRLPFSLLYDRAVDFSNPNDLGFGPEHIDDLIAISRDEYFRLRSPTPDCALLVLSHLREHLAEEHLYTLTLLLAGSDEERARHFIMSRYPAFGYPLLLPLSDYVKLRRPRSDVSRLFALDVFTAVYEASLSSLPPNDPQLARRAATSYMMDLLGERTEEHSTFLNRVCKTIVSCGLSDCLPLLRTCRLEGRLFNDFSSVVRSLAPDSDVSETVDDLEFIMCAHCNQPRMECARIRERNMKAQFATSLRAADRLYEERRYNECIAECDKAISCRGGQPWALLLRTATLRTECYFHKNRVNVAYGEAIFLSSLECFHHIDRSDALLERFERGAYIDEDDDEEGGSDVEDEDGFIDLERLLQSPSPLVTELEVAYFRNSTDRLEAARNRREENPKWASTHFGGSIANPGIEMIVDRRVRPYYEIETPCDRSPPASAFSSSTDIFIFAPELDALSAIHLKTGTDITEGGLHQGVVDLKAFRWQDRNFVASVSSHDFQFRLFELRNVNATKYFDWVHIFSEDTNLLNDVKFLEISTENDCAVVATNAEIGVYSLTDGSKLGTLFGFYCINSLAVYEDRLFVADGTLRFSEYSLKMRSIVRCYVPRRILHHVVPERDRTHSPYLVTASEGYVLAVYGPTHRPLCVVFCRDSGFQIHRVRLKAKAHALCVDAHGATDFAVLGFASGTVYVMDLHTGRFVLRREDLHQSRVVNVQIAFGPRKTLWVKSFSEQGLIRVCEVARRDVYCCEYCGAMQGRQNEMLRRCSRCKTVRYCSRICQVEHWPVHKKFCRSLARKMSL